MRAVTLMVVATVLQIVGIVALVFALVAGVNVLQENGGLKTVVESVWCGNDGCEK